MAKWLYRMAAGTVEKRKAVLGLWLVILVTFGVLGTQFAGTTSDSFTIPGIESQTANDLLAEEFPAANGGTIRVVYAAPEGTTLNDETIQTSIQAGLDEALTAEGVIAVTPMRMSQDERIGFADVIFAVEAQDRQPVTRLDAPFIAQIPGQARRSVVEFAVSETPSRALVNHRQLVRRAVGVESDPIRSENHACSPHLTAAALQV